jgi:glycosyltransferase involved in cell wall biosynthesis
LKTRHSDLKLYVIGKNPDKRLLDAAEGDPDIVFTGFVEDPEAYFKRSRVFIAPLRFGSGIKVKVLNAMYRGIPVVTTSVGNEGLAARHMHHLALADTPEDMVQSILRLLTDNQIWQHLRQESRKLVAEQYTWKKLFADMKHILDAQFERNEKNKQ